MKELEKVLYLKRIKDKRCIVLFSGGIDSTTLLYLLKNFNFKIYAISINYKGRNKKEIEASRKITNLLNIENYIEINLDFLEEIYYVKKELNNNHYLSKTFDHYIPARNGIFFFIATYYAELLGIKYIFTGHTKEDLQRIPDINENFIKSINKAIFYGTYVGKFIKTKVYLPFINLKKRDIVKLIIKYSIPIEITWSCFREFDYPCGDCEGCKKRAEIISLVKSLKER